MLGVGTAPAGLFILAWLPGILADPSPRNILFISAQAGGCGWFEVQTLRAVPASALNDFPAQVALATLGMELAAGDKPSSEIHSVFGMFCFLLALYPRQSQALSPAHVLPRQGVSLSGNEPILSPQLMVFGVLSLLLPLLLGTVLPNPGLGFGSCCSSGETFGMCVGLRVLPALPTPGVTAAPGGTLAFKGGAGIPIPGGVEEGLDVALGPLVWVTRWGWVTGWTR